MAARKSMLKSGVFDILRKSVGEDTTRFLREITVENRNKVLRGCAALITSPLLVIHRPITRRTTREQAFILLHEYLHMQMKHHQILVRVRKRDIGIPRKHNDMFVSFAMDLWVNAKAETILGFEVPQAIKPTPGRLRETWHKHNGDHSHYRWVVRQAKCLWDSEKWRRDVFRIAKKVFGEV